MQSYRSRLIVPSIQRLMGVCNGLKNVSSIDFIYGPLVDQKEFAEDLLKGGKFDFEEHETTVNERVILWGPISYGNKSPLVFLKKKS